MTARRDLDNQIRAYLDQGPTELPNRSFDAVRNQIDHTRHRVVLGPWWMPTMNKLAPIVLGAATVIAVLLLGPRLLGSPTGGVGSQATPSPSLLARGNFVTLRGAVGLEATGEGSSVTGRMTVSEWGAFFTVELQCARTTEDGLIMIGGVTTDTAGGGSGLSPVGTWAGIVLKRGSPVQAAVWAQRGGGTSGADSCLAFLDEQYDAQLIDERDIVPNADHPGPIEGTVELGP